MATTPTTANGNVQYYLYDSTGAIVEAGSNRADLIPNKPGLTVGYGQANHTTHWVNGTTLTPYTPAQVLVRMAQPAYAATWDPRAMAWIDGRDLKTLKTDLVTGVKASRDAVSSGLQLATITLTIGGQSLTFPTADSDNRRYRTSKIGWDAAINASLLTVLSTVDFDDASGTKRSLNYAQLCQLIAAIWMRDNGNFTSARTVISTILNATTAIAASASATSYVPVTS